MEPPKDKEEALAGLLNGTVITLLGGALPTLFVWMIVKNWQQIMADVLHFSGLLSAPAALIGSFYMLRYGLRMLRLNWMSLRTL
ncbi:MAG: hypothetical protein KKF88_07175 [Alphaproteobacteria bacterium]|nr:hypothetical protein [Alphaproteobacteria bacterium]